MDLTHHRDSKRRRVLPPVLDGDARGWAKPAYDDGEEEYESDEDIERQQDAHRNAVDAQSLSPYKSANSFLHDLHTLQRHRLMFALPMPLSTQAPQYQQYTDYQKNNYPQSPSKEFHHSLASYAAHDHVPMGKSILPLISERPRSPEKMASPGSGQELGDIGDSMSVDEVQRVTERYEDTNKYVLSSTRSMEAAACSDISLRAL